MDVFLSLVLARRLGARMALGGKPLKKELKHPYSESREHLVSKLRGATPIIFGTSLF